MKKWKLALAQVWLAFSCIMQPLFIIRAICRDSSIWFKLWECAGLIVFGLLCIAVNLVWVLELKRDVEEDEEDHE